MTVEIKPNTQSAVRLTDPEDAKQVTRLCHQLGYATSLTFRKLL